MKRDRLETTKRHVHRLIMKRHGESPICITCGRPATEAGHFIHASGVGGSGYLRFFPLNIHPQCGACNRWGRGQLERYSLYLDEHYGHKFRSVLSEFRDGCMGWRGWSDHDTKLIRKSSLEEITQEFYGQVVARWREVDKASFMRWEARK